MNPISLGAALRAGCLALSGVVLASGGAAADPLPKVEKKFANGSVLRFYGQINKGVLNYDDGQVSETYQFIDNNNSNTRVGLTYTAKIGNGWDYLGTLEIQYAPYSTSNINLNQPTPPASAYEFTNANIRKIDNRIGHEDYGIFYLGQGDMASNDTVKVDFSGTTVIAGVAVSDSAGAQLLRQTNGTLSSTRISSAFPDYNGLGRKVRFRYDSPSFGGFVVRASYGEDLLSSNEATRDDPLYDIAVAYTGESGDFRYAAQASYSWNDGDTATTTRVGGSGSVLHTPTGLNLTLSSASQDNQTRTGSFYYVKAGWLADLVSWGKTAVSVDYYSGSNTFASGSDSTSTGLSVVQNVTDWNTEFWATYRTYDASTPTTDYEDASAFYVGARFRW